MHIDYGEQEVTVVDLNKRMTKLVCTFVFLMFQDQPLSVEKKT